MVIYLFYFMFFFWWREVVQWRKRGKRLKSREEEGEEEEEEEEKSRGLSVEWDRRRVYPNGPQNLALWASMKLVEALFQVFFFFPFPFMISDFSYFIFIFLCLSVLVSGPMVYGCLYCARSYQKTLSSLNFAGSASKFDLFFFFFLSQKKNPLNFPLLFKLR